MPEPITQEYIYGYSKNERDLKFKEILNKYYNNRNILTYKIKAHQKYAITNNMKQEYEKEKSKLEKKYRDEWADASEYKKNTKK